jgi:hypothetical protein
MLLALVTALMVMLARMAMFYAGHPPQGTDFMLVHFFALVTVVFFAGFGTLRHEPGSGFPGLFRNGFRAAALYALLMGAFLWTYHAHIDAGRFDMEVEKRVMRAVEEGFDELMMRPRIERFFSPFNYASISFFAMLSGGAALSLVSAVLHHVVLRRFRR